MYAYSSKSVKPEHESTSLLLNYTSLWSSIIRMMYQVRVNVQAKYIPLSRLLIVLRNNG